MATQLKPVETPVAPGLRVYSAIAAVSADLASEGIAKGRRNQQQGYQFRGIDDVYNALAPALARHGLCIVPRVLSRTSEEAQTKSGGRLNYVTVEVEYTIAANDGSQIKAAMYGEAMDSADKATNKALSAAYKYLAMQLFCIPTEGDNDADATTHEVKPRETARQRAARESEANGGTHPNNAEPDVSPADAALAISADMRAATTKDALDKVWRDHRALRERIKQAEPAIHDGLVKQFSAEAKRIAEAGDILDDEVPY